MKITLVMAFGEFLHFNFNSAKEFLEKLPESPQLIKKILPVGYFKHDILKPIKEYKPERIIILGMNEDIKAPRFEMVAKNLRVVLKNPFYRFFASIYGYWLKWNGQNIKIKNPISKEKLTELPIDKNAINEIQLHTKIPRVEGIGISRDAGNYVCNYAMWVVEKFIPENIAFYFVHLPPKLEDNHEEELSKFILS